MNQIFKITVGSDTLDGRLPAKRVGKCYCAKFQIAGIDEDVASPPRVWVTTNYNNAALYYIATYNTTSGLWEAIVGADGAATVGTFKYSLTAFDSSSQREYLVGEGDYVVYDNVPAHGGVVGTSDSGTSITTEVETLKTQVATLQSFITTLKAALLAKDAVKVFDPSTAYDSEVREQVDIIGDAFRAASIS